mgnify:FL=1
MYFNVGCHGTKKPKNIAKDFVYSNDIKHYSKKTSIRLAGSYPSDSDAGCGC